MRDGKAPRLVAFPQRRKRRRKLVRARQMIADIRDPRRYAVWMVPVVGARVPRAG